MSLFQMNRSINLNCIDKQYFTFKNHLYFIRLFILFAPFWLQAQDRLFDRESVVKFVKSSRFLEYGRIVNNPYGSDRSSYVELLPSEMEWQWSQKDDSLALGVVLPSGGTSFIVFKNDIQAFTGMDKKEIGEYLVRKLQSFDSTHMHEDLVEVTSFSQPVDSMYGFLYRVHFYNKDQRIRDLGSIIQFLLHTQLSTSQEFDRIQLVIPQYGFKRDSLELGFAQLNDFFGSDVWQTWLGLDEGQFVLYVKNKVFNYAHLFFTDSARQNKSGIPLLELIAFIPDDNVKNIFKLNRDKTNGLNLEIQTK
jgi:hypothetical protein